jgi:hypothetical protein
MENSLVTERRYDEHWVKSEVHSWKASKHPPRGVYSDLALESKWWMANGIKKRTLFFELLRQLETRKHATIYRTCWNLLYHMDRRLRSALPLPLTPIKEIDAASCQPEQLMSYCRHCLLHALWILVFCSLILHVQYISTCAQVHGWDNLLNAYFYGRISGIPDIAPQGISGIHGSRCTHIRLTLTGCRYSEDALLWPVAWAPTCPSRHLWKPSVPLAAR